MTGLSSQALHSDVENKGIKWKMTAGKTFTLPLAFLHVKSSFCFTVMEKSVHRVSIGKSAWVVAITGNKLILFPKRATALPSFLVLTISSNTALSYAIIHPLRRESEIISNKGGLFLLSGKDQLLHMPTCRNLLEQAHRRDMVQVLPKQWGSSFPENQERWVSKYSGMLCRAKHPGPCPQVWKKQRPGWESHSWFMPCIIYIYIYNPFPYSITKGDRRAQSIQSCHCKPRCRSWHILLPC